MSIKVIRRTYHSCCSIHNRDSSASGTTTVTSPSGQTTSISRALPVTDIRDFNTWNANKFLGSPLVDTNEATGQAASRQPRAALSATPPNTLSVGFAADVGRSQLGIDRRLAERIEKFQNGAEASVEHSWERLDRRWTLFGLWHDGSDRDLARWKIGGQVEVDESVRDEVFARCSPLAASA